MINEKHLFAVYTEFPARFDDTLKISDKLIYHRIVRVLRLKKEDLLILFNKQFNILTKISKIEKESIEFKINEKKINKKFDPKITILLSLLKKESFEEALYYCVELGANYIQPIITQKSRKKINSAEYERQEKILISAAEQSKNFDFPQLKEPIILQEILNECSKRDLIKIYFDPKGSNLSEILKIIPQNQNKEIILFIGPEGDLNIEEKELIKKAGFIFCSLTPTILRSQVAVCLSLGIFRSIFK